MTTLGKISEQIIREFEGGNPSSDSSVDIREVQELVVQHINQLLKAEHINMHMAARNHMPPHTLIAKYENIAVTAPVDPEVRCSRVGPDLYTPWATEGGDLWTTPGGDTWIVDQDVSVNVDVTEVAAATGYTYIIAITNIQFPTGTVVDDVQTALDGCTAGNYLQFYGFDSGIPNTFVVDGIDNIVVASTSITIYYNPASASAAPYSVYGAASVTHSLLADGTKSYGTTQLDQINCCGIDKNSQVSKARVALPAIPLNMRKGMGVWRVYNPSDIHNPYIPVESSQYGMILDSTHNGLASVLADKICYEYSDRSTLIFNKTLAEMPGTVTIEMLIVDPATLASTDMLPVTPEIEAEIISRIVQTLRGRNREDKIVDNNEAR